jgi:hypothetical protein
VDDAVRCVLLSLSTCQPVDTHTAVDKRRLTALVVDIRLKIQTLLSNRMARALATPPARHRVSRKFTRSSCWEPDSAWKACAAALPWPSSSEMAVGISPARAACR